MIIYKPTATIKAMTFDLDDTLYNNWPYIIEAEKGLLNYIADKYPDTAHLQKSDWQDYKRQALRNDPQLWSDMGDLRRVTLSAGLSDIGYHGVELQKAVEDCFTWFYHARSDFEVAQDICEILRKLSEQIPLVAITNGNVNLAQIGIAPYFCQTYKASRQNPMKPSRHMFDAAATFLKLAPKHILHVGDNLEKDVWGATNAGYASAWHACDRPMKLASEPVTLLPNVAVDKLEELLLFI